MERRPLSPPRPGGAYLAGQAEHHGSEDFNFELLRLLRAHGVEFEEKYVFD
ncbi:MAG: hypothetical protein J0L61_06865 [Planctomycetes bacterium]|nr:hypothetical protein [Planctomycetota bacterium]